jgi:4-amino-4-deoxy-L-arabinose transferase-like glycosyltransferase
MTALAANAGAEPAGARFNPTRLKREFLAARWLWLLAAFVLLSGFLQRGPWPADEPRFTLVAQQMVASGDYWFPHRGIQIYPDKPPVFMWLQAGFYHLTGSWNAAFLLPSLLAGIGTLLLVFDLSLRLFGARAARISTLALLLSVHFSYQFKKAQIDPLLVFFVTLSVYALLRYLLLGAKQRWLFIGAFFAGLGVITKGVGVIALLVFLPYVLAKRLQAIGIVERAEKTPTWRAVFLVVSGFLLPIALWLGPLVWQVYVAPTPERLAYLQNILFKQTAQRYAAAWHHQQGPLYFPEVMLTTWMPVIFVLPWAVRAWWRRLRGVRTGAVGSSAPQFIRKPDARYVLLLGWVLCVLLFFSLSKGKRDMYILPALPMLAVISGPALIYALRKTGFQVLCYSFAALLASALFGGGVAALIAEPKFERTFEANYELMGANDAIWMLFASVGALGLLGCALAMFWRRVHGGFAAYCAVLTLIWTLIFGFVGYPLFDATGSARAVMQRARAAVGPQVSIGLVAWKEQNYLQLSGPKTDFGFLAPHSKQRLAAFTWLREQPDERALFILDDALGACVTRSRSVNLGQANRRVWWLVRINALKPDCDASAELVPDADRKLVK